MSDARARRAVQDEAPPVYRVWEPARFDAAPRDLPVRPGSISLPTIEEIDAIQEQAREEAYAAGHAEGLAAGLAEGREAAAGEAARLAQLAAGFAEQTRQTDETVSQQLLDLALDLARAMLKSALAVQPERVIPVVREAVRYLPAMQQPALLYLHPDDLALVQQRIGDELAKTGWQLAEDATIEAGGCRVETPSNQIDATLPVRWQRLAAALGQNAGWLA